MVGKLPSDGRSGCFKRCCSPPGLDKIGGIVTLAAPTVLRSECVARHPHSRHGTLDNRAGSILDRPIATLEDRDQP